jgi:CheY-like chemotaxis protein
MTDKPLILVADDETRIRRLVVESLENAGFDVCQA